MKPVEIILDIYRHFLTLRDNKQIPIVLRHKQLIGTTQDDPFDNWIQHEIEAKFDGIFEVFNTGKLQTPDLIIRHIKTREIVCIEVKKLTQKANGNDPRGGTIDFNSSLPCGRTIINVGNDSVIVPVFYLFALLNQDNSKITTLLFVDGDFLNFDLKLHKEAKTSNYMEYGHGPYGEGSVRHRKMYVYPNPLNSKLDFFSNRHLVVAKKSELELIDDLLFVTEEILRVDENENVFRFLLKDETRDQYIKDIEELPVLNDIFQPLKKRISKDRSLSVPKIPK